MQSRTEALEISWSKFENLVKTLPNLNLDNLTNIKKLMTAEFVVVISSHEIYRYTAFVHELTRKIIELSNSFPAVHQRWLEVLRARNQQPFKVRHHQHMPSTTY